MIKVNNFRSRPSCSYSPCCGLSKTPTCQIHSYRKIYFARSHALAFIYPHPTSSYPPLYTTFCCSHHSFPSGSTSPYPLSSILSSLWITIIVFWQQPSSYLAPLPYPHQNITSHSLSFLEILKIFGLISIAVFTNCEEAIHGNFQYDKD